MNVTVDFNKNPLTCAGEAGRQHHFRSDNSRPTADNWKAIFELVQKLHVED